MPRCSRRRQAVWPGDPSSLPSAAAYPRGPYVCRPSDACRKTPPPGAVLRYVPTRRYELRRYSPNDVRQTQLVRLRRQQPAAAAEQLDGVAGVVPDLALAAGVVARAAPQRAAVTLA